MLSDAEMRLVGGSDVAAIVGLSPYGGPFSVWSRIVHGVERADNAQMQAGRAAEPYIRELYRASTGAELLGAQKLQPRSWARVSLDDLAVRGGARRVVEMKRCNGEAARAWGYAGTTEIPDYYGAQTQWYLGFAKEAGLADEDVADVAALLDGELAVYHWQHDPEDFAWLVEAAERFFRDYVETRRPPPVKHAQSADMEAMPLVWPRHREGFVAWDALSTEEQVLVRLWLDANAARKAAEKTEKMWAAELRVLLAERSGVEGLPADTGHRRVDFKANKDALEVDWKSLLQEARTLLPASAWEALQTKHTKSNPGSRPLVARSLRKDKDE